MGTERDRSATITLDLKRYKIRLHQETLKKMGNPQYVQFLINPEEMYFAVLGTNRPVKGATSNRVRPVRTSNHHYTVEFCSTELVKQIAAKIGNLDYRFSYRLTGEVDLENRVAYYSLRTLKKIERELSEDGKRLLCTKNR